MKCDDERKGEKWCSHGGDIKEKKQYGHGGDIYRNPVTYDFSINVNPLGMPERVKQILKASVDGWCAYPDPECKELVDALSRYHQIPSEWILCGNGAADLIYRLVWAIRPHRALIASPTFSEYGRALEGMGCQADVFSMREEEDFRLNVKQFADMVTKETDLVFLCNPNNPNGLLVSRQDVLHLADVCRRMDAYLVVDECFCGLLERPDEYSVISSLEGRTELVVLRAFTKTYAMAGLRLGYVACENRGLLERMGRYCQPWNISIPAQQAGVAALAETGYLAKAREMIAAERGRLVQELRCLGLKVYPSSANYLLFRYPKEGGSRDSDHRDLTNRELLTPEATLWERCVAGGVLIRDCSNYRGLCQGYYRVCIRNPRENDELLRVLEAALA